MMDGSAPAPDLDIRQIAAIDRLAALRSFQAAADAINVSQATLSRLIAGAESGLGVPLFQRGWSGAETTSEGDIVLRTCKAALSDIARAEAALFTDVTHPVLAHTLRLSQLAVIAATARTGGATQAAQQLGRNQSDVSRTLNDVTRHLGLDLFRRERRGLTAQPAAIVLSDLHDSLRHCIAALPAELMRDRGMMTGRVSVGLLPFSGQDLIPRVFARMTRLHPRVRLVCVPGSYPMLTEALRRREIDCVIGTLRGTERPAGLRETHLYDESYTIVARRDHPVPDRPGSLADLAGLPWVVAPDGTPVRRYFDSLFTGAAPVVQTCEIWSFSAVEAMLADSDALAMLSYGPAQLARLRPDLKQITVPRPLPAAPIGLAHRAQDDASPAIAAFEAILTTVVASQSPHDR